MSKLVAFYSRADENYFSGNYLQAQRDACGNQCSGSRRGSGVFHGYRDCIWSVPLL